MSKRSTEEKAEKTAKRSRKGVGGRPSKYDPAKTPGQGYKLCLLGATDKEVADFFGVAESTLNKWKIDYPEFSESLNRGKVDADARVAESLFKRALGYSHPEDDIRVANGEIAITPTIKHYPPDTAAAIFWLKNRQRGKWRDKIEHDHGVQPDMSMSPMRIEKIGRATSELQSRENLVCRLLLEKKKRKK